MNEDEPGLTPVQVLERLQPWGSSPFSAALRNAWRRSSAALLQRDLNFIPGMEYLMELASNFFGRPQAACISFRG
jgi:hypothetical protein